MALKSQEVILERPWKNIQKPRNQHDLGSALELRQKQLQKLVNVRED